MLFLPGPDDVGHLRWVRCCKRALPGELGRCEIVCCARAAEEASDALRLLATADGAYEPPAQYIVRLSRIGDPRQYVIPNHEQIVGMNRAGELALFRSIGKERIRVPAGVEPVFHTHPLGGSPLPSDTDFLNVPVGEVQ